jgi:Transposase DDE domain
LGSLLDGLTDERPQPRIATLVVSRSLFVMIVGRLGSLNALEQTQSSSFWRRFLGAALPSADTLGRVAAQVDPDSVRQALQALYTGLKRNKALPPPKHGLMPLVLDGHESHSTEHRHCSGCLERKIATARGERLQYYHRHVTALLLGRDFPVLLDAEPLRAGEDEVATALRLLERLLHRFPRAFDVVLGDALYTDPRLYNFLLDHGKDALTVLKNEDRNLLIDARALIETHSPQLCVDGATTREVWDLQGFTTWPQVHRPVRVVRSRETTRTRRQLDGQLHVQEADWVWVTTLSAARASTPAVVHLGHARWSIENQGFNETTNRWCADHVYRHHPMAMLLFCLMTMVAFNLFYAFFYRNLQPAYRSRHSALHVARCLASELYQGLSENRAPPPS